MIAREVKLEGGRGGQRTDRENSHRAENSPALTLVAHHDSVGAGEGERDKQDQEDLDEICEAVRILERVRGVRVEETATVRAELLDRFLARDGPAGNDLCSTGEGVHVLGGVEVLDGAAGDQKDRADERDRQKDAEVTAHEVNPEVTELIRAVAGNTADDHDSHADSDGGRNEVLERHAQHLREMGHRRFTAVRLPVRVGHERGCRVPRLRLFDGAEAVCHGQPLLNTLQDVEAEHTQEGHGENVAKVNSPRVLAVCSDPREAVHEPLRPEVALRGKGARHVRAERSMHRDECRDENEDLNERHDYPNLSGRMSA